jgi:hypothetical protein
MFVNVEVVVVIVAVVVVIAVHVDSHFILKIQVSIVYIKKEKKTNLPEEGVAIVAICGSKVVVPVHIVYLEMIVSKVKKRKRK